MGQTDRPAPQCPRHWHFPREIRPQTPLRVFTSGFPNYSDNGLAAVTREAFPDSVVFAHQPSPVHQHSNPRVAWRNGNGSSRRAAYRRFRSYYSDRRGVLATIDLFTLSCAQIVGSSPLDSARSVRTTFAVSDSLCSRRGCGCCMQRPSAVSRWLSRYLYVAWLSAPPTSSPRRGHRGASPSRDFRPEDCETTVNRRVVRSCH
jgi:hypothetical protein